MSRDLRKRLEARLTRLLTSAEGRPVDADAYCKTLWTLNDGRLERRPSTLPNAGQGLFTRQHIAAGTVVTWYDGAVIAKDAYMLLKSYDPTLVHYAADLGLQSYVVLGDHLVDHGDNLVRIRYRDLDRVFTGRGAAQFCNSTRKEWSLGRNATFINVTDHRWLHFDHPAAPLNLDLRDALIRAHPRGQGRLRLLVTLRDVAAGEELLVYYGRHYVENYL